jgi:hypothetical protein
MFRETRYPTMGPLLGVFRWAANLGIPRFNFDIEFHELDISLLDAYD